MQSSCHLCLRFSSGFFPRVPNTHCHHAELAHIYFIFISGLLWCLISKKEKVHHPNSLKRQYWISSFKELLKIMLKIKYIKMITFLCYVKRSFTIQLILSFLGWGDDITWVQTYEDGLAKMVERYPLVALHTPLYMLQQIINSQYLCFIVVKNLWWSFIIWKTVHTVKVCIFIVLLLNIQHIQHIPFLLN